MHFCLTFKRFYVSVYRTARKSSGTLGHIQGWLPLLQIKGRHGLSCMILSLATIAVLRAVRICEIIQDVGGLWYQVLLRIGTQEKFNLACHVILWKDKLDKSHHK